MSLVDPLPFAARLQRATLQALGPVSQSESFVRRFARKVSGKGESLAGGARHGTDIGQRKPRCVEGEAPGEPFLQGCASMKRPTLLVVHAGTVVVLIIYLSSCSRRMYVSVQSASRLIDLL